MNVQRRPTDRSQCKATYQDVLDSSPNMVAEVLAGTLHAHPRPAMRHAWASSRLGGRLDGPYGPEGDDPGGWWIVDEPELHMGEDIVVPDFAGWRPETMPEYPDAAYCTIAPDWACKALSPSTLRIDLNEKRTIYAREGVSHLWFVDPDARTLGSFALRDGQWALLATLADDAPVALAPHDAISFPLDALWPAGATADDDAQNSASTKATGRNRTRQDRSRAGHPHRQAPGESSADMPSRALPCRPEMQQVRIQPRIVPTRRIAAMHGTQGSRPFPRLKERVVCEAHR